MKVAGTQRRRKGLGHLQSSALELVHNCYVVLRGAATSMRDSPPHTPKIRPGPGHNLLNGRDVERSGREKFRHYPVKPSSPADSGRCQGRDRAQRHKNPVIGTECSSASRPQTEVGGQGAVPDAREFLAGGPMNYTSSPIDHPRRERLDQRRDPCHFGRSRTHGRN